LNLLQRNNQHLSLIRLDIRHPIRRRRVQRNTLGGAPFSGRGRRLAALIAALLSAGGCGGTALQRLATPVFYPPPPAEPRFEFLGAISSEDDLGSSSGFEDFLVGAEVQARKLIKPYGVAMYGHKLYVTDTVFGGVIVIDPEEGFERFAGDAGAGALKTPINITITPDGDKFVADTGRGQVLAYDAHDAFVRGYGSAAQFKPTAVAVTADLLYVCDVRDSEIEVLSRATGEVVRKIGSLGTEPGQLRLPTNLALGPDGNLYVTDTGNFRVQKLSPDGAVLGTFGAAGDGPGMFTRPKGIAVDAAGRIYVADAAFENVQVFDPEFRLLLVLGGPGSGPGDLALPAGVAVTATVPAIYRDLADPRFDAQHLVLVVSQYGARRINIFAFGVWRGARQPTPPAPAPPDAAP
jgi:DNA-binding beta-propeller fold protein YncE